MRTVSLAFGMVLALSGCHRPAPAPFASGASAPPAPAPAAEAIVRDPPDAGAQASVSGFPGHRHDIDGELIHFNATRGKLGGFLYKPKGPGPFPAVLYNHGSERLPGNKFGQALFFVKHGFVLFVPHRLGHGQSPGEYIVDARDSVPPAARDTKLVESLVDQVQDVDDATAYLKSLSFVDARALAMVGCSFGGIETVLATKRELGVRAAVAFATAAQTWGGNAPLRQALKDAARSAKAPLLFLQAENDFDVRPSLELASEMEASGRPHAMKIFPPKGSTPEEGHSFCMGGMDPPWGDEVLAFFAKNGVTGAVPATR